MCWTGAARWSNLNAFVNIFLKNFSSQKQACHGMKNCFAVTSSKGNRVERGCEAQARLEAADSYSRPHWLPACLPAWMCTSGAPHPPTCNHPLKSCSYEALYLVSTPSCSHRSRPSSKLDPDTKARLLPSSIFNKHKNTCWHYMSLKKILSSEIVLLMIVVVIVMVVLEEVTAAMYTHTHTRHWVEDLRKWRGRWGVIQYLRQGWGEGGAGFLNGLKAIIMSSDCKASTWRGDNRKPMDWGRGILLREMRSYGRSGGLKIERPDGEGSRWRCSRCCGHGVKERIS